MAREPLNAFQLDVLRWIGQGCPDGVMNGDGHKMSARALESRRLVKVSRPGGVWSAALTEEGVHYLQNGRYLEPPPESRGPAVEPSTWDVGTERLLWRQAKRVVAAKSAAAPPPSSRSRPRTPPKLITRLEPVSMRYKIVVSRVQIAERHVRAPSEDEALAKIRAELEKPYGFIGGWQTVDTDMDIVEAVNPLDGPPQQILDKDGGFLLTIKGAAKYLGLSYSTLYEMVNRGEIAHVVVGTRRYISRDQMTGFIDGHSHTGGNYGLRNR